MEIATSPNEEYLFSIGSENLLKVWDYNLRGNLSFFSFLI